MQQHLVIHGPVSEKLICEHCLRADCKRWQHHVSPIIVCSQIADKFEFHRPPVFSQVCRVYCKFQKILHVTGLCPLKSIQLKAFYTLLKQEQSGLIPTKKMYCIDFHFYMQTPRLTLDNIGMMTQVNELGYQIFKAYFTLLGGNINICKSVWRSIDCLKCVYLQGTILISRYLVIPVTVAVQRGEHDAEGAGPLTEEDEEVMSQALLWKQEAPVVHWGGGRVKPVIGSVIERTESAKLYKSLKLLTNYKSPFSDMIIRC